MVASGTVLSLWGVLALRIAPRRVAGLPHLWARYVVTALRLCCGIDIRLVNPELLPEGAAIIAAQHQSALDIFIWLALLPRPAFVFKQELANIPLFGRLLVPCGMVPVQRGGGARALRQMVTDCRAALERGQQVVIFPEGTRVSPGARVSLRSGIASLAKSTGAPVIPAATDSGLRWGPRAFHKTAGPARVKLFPPLGENIARDGILPELSRIFYEEGVR